MSKNYREPLLKLMVQNPDLNIKVDELKNLKDDALLVKEGIIDSLGLVQLVNEIESKFEITVNEEDLVDSNFESIAAIIRFIETKKKT